MVVASALPTLRVEEPRETDPLPDKPHIYVEGYAEVEVEPDQMITSVGLASVNDELEVAKADVERVMVAANVASTCVPRCSRVARAMWAIGSAMAAALTVPADGNPSEGAVWGSARSLGHQYTRGARDTLSPAPGLLRRVA